MEHDARKHLCFRCQRVYHDIKYGKIDAFNTTINAPGFECDCAWDCGLETKAVDNGGGFWVVECSHFIPVPQAKLYADYMKSEQWEAVRNQRIKHDGYKCVKCGSAVNLCVHHLTYENLGDEPLGDLITLCDKCHKAIHAADLEKK